MCSTRRRWGPRPSSCSPAKANQQCRRRSRRRSHFPPLEGPRPVRGKFGGARGVRERASNGFATTAVGRARRRFRRHPRATLTMDDLANPEASSGSRAGVAHAHDTFVRPSPPWRSPDPWHDREVRVRCCLHATAITPRRRPGTPEVRPQRRESQARVRDSPGGRRSGRETRPASSRPPDSSPRSQDRPVGLTCHAPPGRRYRRPSEAHA